MVFVYNNAIFRTGHLQNIVTIDNNALDKVEVMFGPSSLQYGSDALGGAVLMKTREARFGNTRKSKSVGWKCTGKV
jgi:hemoglobin/transferrin/lactoferrin receptor protein